MKKLLFATAFASTALASSMGCNTDTLTGLHFGLGVSVLFDKYEADVHVGTIGEYLKTAVYTASDENKTVTADMIKDLTIKSPMTYYIRNKQEAGDHTLTGVTAAFAGPSVAVFTKQHTFKKRTTNCGGEIKLAYFHDFGNHLMVGVDLTGVIASKNKKSITVDPEVPVYNNGELNIYENYNFIPGVTNQKVEGASVNRNTGVATGYTTEIKLTEDEPLTVSVGAPLADWLSNSNYTSAIEITNLSSSGKDAPYDDTVLLTAQPNKILTDGSFEPLADKAQLTFEKSVFNPRLAFIVGGTVYGWFAGLRLGMSYTTGKVYATGGSMLHQETQSKTVSISSPLIGLHLMKQMKIAGNNDAHLYLTADWNIGDGRRSVYMNGVRNFKQSGYNISAGLTWRFKLGS